MQHPQICQTRGKNRYNIALALFNNNTGSDCTNSVVFIIIIIINLFKTGYGGGFNERENLVYNEREESDGEYDEVDVFYY